MTGKKVGNSEFRCFAAGRSGKSVYLIGPRLVPAQMCDDWAGRADLCPDADCCCVTVATRARIYLGE